MTEHSMSTESASVNPRHSRKSGVNYNRMLKYKALASAFSYPNEQDLVSEYDRLFRRDEIWLYGAEYAAKNEFQRSCLLSDIAGFYKAFGLETDKDRPDFLASELEFMYYLTHKELNAADQEKAFICRDAARKFFDEHLYPASKKIAEKIITDAKGAKGSPYSEAAEDLLEFLESEKKIFAE